MKSKRIIIITVVFITILGLVSFLTSPLFNIRNYEIKGVNFLEKEIIIDIINPYLSENIFRVRTGQIEKKIDNNNIIKNVNVYRSYPDILTVEIEERKPVARINNNNSYILFCNQGFIIEENSLYQEVPLLKNTGYSFSGSKINFSLEINKIVQALNNIHPDTLKYIDQISYNPENIELIILSEIDTYMGNINDIQKKFKILEGAVEMIELYNLDVKYIDLSITNKPVIKQKIS